MDRLISKIAAGGLSAGVFLIWWPQHIHSDGVSQLVLRGLLWSLLTELLLVMLGPLELRAEARLHELLAPRRDRVRTRLDAVPRPARTGGIVALAFCGIAAPLALLAGSPAHVLQEKQPQVVRQVIVKRPVVQKKIVVRRVVTRAPLQSTGAAPSVPTSQVPTAPAAATPVVRPERVSAPAAKRRDAPTVRRAATTKAQTTTTSTTPAPTTAATSTPTATGSGQPYGETTPAAPAATPQQP